MYQKILLPIDASASSRVAAASAQGLACAFNARLLLVHSFHSNTVPDLAPGALDFVERSFYPESEDLMQSYLGPLNQAGLAGEPLLVRGDPADVVVALAQQRQVDLIVMGRHGQRSLKHLFLGSVSRYQAHRKTPSFRSGI
ncbi:MAG: universal stress protein [Candidatus Sericytochromatia bacterium]|nr:universal stress protein [Candidatus Sericytochromatia bacterium]